MGLKAIFLKLLKRKINLLCLGFLSLVILGSIFAPFIAPNDPTEVVLQYKLQGPSVDFPLGTDDMGRCVLSRLIYGARVSMSIAVIVMTIGLVNGTIIGTFSAYKGGRIDQLIMRICDIFLAFPSLVLVLVIVGILGPGIVNIIIAMVIVNWLWYARIIRGMVLSLKERPFISAAKIAGSSDRAILWHHILPNIIPQIIVLSTLEFGSVILHISGFSFLGLGVQPPTPEWGIMINDGRQFMRSTPTLMAYPGMMIVLTVISLNLLGDSLRDIVEEN